MFALFLGLSSWVEFQSRSVRAPGSDAEREKISHDRQACWAFVCICVSDFLCISLSIEGPPLWMFSIGTSFIFYHHVLDFSLPAAFISVSVSFLLSFVKLIHITTWLNRPAFEPHQRILKIIFLSFFSFRLLMLVPLCLSFDPISVLFFLLVSQSVFAYIKLCENSYTVFAQKTHHQRKTPTSRHIKAGICTYKCMEDRKHSDVSDGEVQAQGLVFSLSSFFLFLFLSDDKAVL